MRTSDQLADFVGHALSHGRSRDEITGALTSAGWRPEEVAAALRAWSPVEFTPPVPRPRPQLTAAEAFIYGCMFTALAISASHMVWLGFELIDRWLPDPARDSYNSYNAWAIRWSIAMLIVAMPVFLLINAHTVRAERADAGRRRSGVGRWFGYVTLFLALLSLAGDLVSAIYATLSGDLTASFVAKSALVAAVAGLIYLYFRARLEGGQDDKVI